MDKDVHFKKRDKKKIRPRNQSKFHLFFRFVFFLLPFFIVGIYTFSNGYFGSHKIASPIPDAVYITGTPEKLSVKNAPKTSSELLLTLLKDENIQVATVSGVSDGSILVTLGMGGEVIFAPAKDLSLQTSSLQLILSRLTIEGKRFSRLDFRFDKPVITLR